MITNDTSDPGCPSWCQSHAQQPDVGDEPNVFHRSSVLGWGNTGHVWATRGNLPRQSLPASITVDGTDGSLYDIDAAGARELAARLTELADALDKG